MSKNKSGETSVADCINEQNGNGHDQPELLPSDRRNFFITSEQNKKRFTWIIGTSTGILLLLTVWSNWIRDDTTQGLDIEQLKKDQSAITETVKTNHKTTQQQIKENHKDTQQQIKEAAKVPAENAKSLHRVETMQAVLLQAVEDMKNRSD